jgi:cytochrome P450 family 6
MWITVLVLSASFVLLLYLYFTRNYGSYKAKGCTEMKPTFPFGSSNVWDLYTGKTALNGLMDDPYWQYKNDKFIVYWEFDQPRFVIRDIELAKRIMVKDFDHFPDRRKFDLHYSGGNKYLMNMFSIMEGDKWKLMRHILTPAFTSGKLKHMTKYIHKVADDMVLYLKDAAKKEELLETKKVMNNFTVDTIATCGFGIEANSFKNPNNPFIENVAKLSTDGKNIPLRKKIEFFIMMFAPKLSQLFKLQMMDTDAAMFFVSIIRETMKERRMKKHVRRNDFVDLMLEHLTNTTVEEESVVENHQGRVLLENSLVPKL